MAWTVADARIRTRPGFVACDETHNGRMLAHGNRARGPCHGMISRETWRTHRAVAAALGLAVACGSGHRSESLDPGGANGTLDGGGNGTDGGASSGKMTFGSGDGGSAGFSVTIEGPSQGALSVLASSCAGDCDDVTASAVGGVPPYTYAWSDGVKGASRHLCPTSSTTL